MARAKRFTAEHGEGVRFDCPGCGDRHATYTRRDAGHGGPTWGWNGDLLRPTLTPSVLVTLRDPDREIPDETCHSFVRDGRIQFLTDCTHALAGQTVDLPEIPE